MEEKIITLAVLSYEKAHILKSMLDSDDIECFLENANLIQGAVSAGVKVKISESDLEKAMGVLESMMQDDLGVADRQEENIPPRVLLPVDFSDYSKKAAVFAMDWAHQLGAEITVLHAYFNPVISAVPFSDTFAYDMNMDDMVMELEQKAKEGMNDILSFMEKKNNTYGDKKIEINQVLVKGVAEDEIVRYSNGYKPLIIIMGTRGVDRKSADLIGSVTAEVMEKVKQPMMAIPEDFEYKGLDMMKNLLYATDFQEADFKAIDILEKVVRPLGVKIICAHVGSVKRSEWDDVRMTGLGEYLRKKYNETDVVCDLVEHEDFYVGLESYLRSHKIDVLSFTRRKRNLLSRLLNPNIAKKMLFHSTTPLLVFND